MDNTQLDPSVSEMNPLAADLDHILMHTESLWEDLRGQRIFITGGTGFFGCWLLESFAWANDLLKLSAEAVVLTRNPGAFGKKLPHLAAHPAIRFHSGDVRSFIFPKGAFTHVIHAATEAAPHIMKTDHLQVFDVNVGGTRRVLEFARQSGVHRFLFTSSGAVYGRQPPELTHLPEDYSGAPDPTDTQSTYGTASEAKRAAETLCALYARQFGLETTIARCFSFVGPYLPLDGKFAIGNFIRDGMRGDPLHVRGDGTPYRSYLYAADLAVWLWTILIRGKPCHPYHVGSEDSLTITQLADTVATAFQPARIVIVDQSPVSGAAAQRYVPSTKRARADLSLQTRINLKDAIQRTISWNQ